MVFVGIKNESEAKNLWAYLSQFAADGKKKYAVSHMNFRRQCPIGPVAADQWSRDKVHLQQRPIWWAEAKDKMG
jgi:hypothetical protein